MADDEFMGQVFAGNDITLLVEYVRLPALNEKGDWPLAVCPLVEKFPVQFVLEGMPLSHA